MKQLKLELEPRSLDFLFFSPVSFHVLKLCCPLFFQQTNAYFHEAYALGILPSC